MFPKRTRFYIFLFKVRLWDGDDGFLKTSTYIPQYLSGGSVSHCFELGFSSFFMTF